MAENTPKQEEATRGWKFTVIFVLGISIGVGAGWIWFRNHQVPAAPSVTRGEEDGTVHEAPSTSLQDGALSAAQQSGVVPSTNSVAADDQLAGMTAFVRSASLSVDGWAVVYEDRLGQPGNALGALRLDAGVHEDISVPLLRPMTPAGVYHVVLHQDNGDRTFNLDDDFPIRDENGNPIMTAFRTADGSAGL